MYVLGFVEWVPSSHDVSPEPPLMWCFLLEEEQQFCDVLSHYQKNLFLLIHNGFMRRLLTNGVTEQRPAERVDKVPIKRKVLRRRTHCAFALEYRDPSNDACQITSATRDEQNAVCGRLMQNLDKSVSEGNKGSKNTQLRCQFDAASKRKPRQDCIEVGGSPTRKCLGAIENSSELGGLLGFRIPSHGGVFGPLVETASSLINNLQLASTSEDFVRKENVPNVAKIRNRIVLTGFSKEEERELQPYASILGLKVQAKINDRTYCVISAKGDRTLNTLRAVISGVPVLDACVEANKFIPLDRYHYDRWESLMQKREQNWRLFSGTGSIFVCDGCSPPKNDIEWMIEKSGGAVTNDPCECAVVVAPSDHTLEILCSSDLELPPPVVVEKYILDCISENRLLDFEDYMEHDVVKEKC
ncbi:unnamed protein product [Haemonchus placei]|uniref:BRCT domain-containing protein n=1 Tax=Haemonchus placei TaxID=6290 RepID=A0A0N4WV02_HAEPC|nr:unnamed protein product [Haemonchus placei]